MNKQAIISAARLLLTPILIMILGMILLVNPDSASALIAKILGWLLTAIGIGFGAAALVSSRKAGKLTAAVLFCLAGMWLLRNPLLLAAWTGRFVGIFLFADSFQDILLARRRGDRYVLPLLCAGLGVVLIVMPMATSRLVLSACGLVVLIIGTIMLLDRLKDRKRLDPPEDPNIVDAL